MGKDKDIYAKILWFTGLSGAGKTTIANGIKERLKQENIKIIVLDGDKLRNGINKDLGFSLEDRKENIRRVAEIAKLFKDEGFLTIVSFISPTKEIRDLAKNIVSEDDFVEVFINAPLEKCIQRDVKGLYKKAISGEINNFTGINSPYERPVNPDIIIDTAKLTVEESVEKIIKTLI